MSLIFILELALQAGLIVHVIRTGRNTLWILAIALLPGAGSLAYFVVEILPGLFGGRGARRAKAGLERIMDPQRDLRQAAAEVEISGNVDARRRLAEELRARGQHVEAIAVYEAGLHGVFEHDATLLLGLAQAQFAAGNSRQRARRWNGSSSTTRNSSRPMVICCMPGPSRPWTRWTPRNTNMPPSPRGSLVRKRGCAMACC